MIKAIRAVNAFMTLPENEGKRFICHCSGGIGRTGVFFVVREMMRLIDAGEEIESLKIILKMRCNRSKHFVQTFGQLELCYQALKRYREMKAVEGAEALRNSSAHV